MSSRDADAKVDTKVDTKTARLYDKRTVERNIKKGLITRKDYEKHMKTLEDIASKGLYGGAVGDDDDDDIAEDQGRHASGGANGSTGESH
jgi:hypothetical protein